MLFNVLINRFIGFLLAGMFGCFGWVRADLNVHGVDDIVEILHHSNSLQRRDLLSGSAVHTLQQREIESNINFYSMTNTHTHKGGPNFSQLAQMIKY